jgi:predicted O-methyltransferase YrrM
MKIIDCFPYFNEEEHLILRINLLKDYVDKFVICEANKTHTGLPKEYTVEKILKKNSISLDKIYIHKIELPSKEAEPNDWFRERTQRDDVSKLIKDDEIWFISDCDELLNPKYINWYKKVVLDNPDCIIRTRMSFHISNSKFQLFGDDGLPIYWDNPFFVLQRHIKKYTLSQIRESISLSKEIEFPSIYITEDNKILETGWHLSWMGLPERRITKLESFMHNEDFIENGLGYLNTDKTKEYIQNYIPKENGTDILGRTGHILKKYDVFKLPNLILENQKLKTFFLDDYIPHIYEKPCFGENWFTYHELYQKMVETFNTGVFVEVGSWKGKSSSFMATEIANSKKNIKFFCVDTWEGSVEHKNILKTDNLYSIFIENMKSLKEYYTPIKTQSVLASQQFDDASIDFLFLDASHEYEDVKDDILAWWPKIKKGGYFAGHDYYDNIEWGGVKKAVDEYFVNHNIKIQKDCFVILK